MSLELRTIAPQIHSISQHLYIIIANFYLFCSFNTPLQTWLHWAKLLFLSHFVCLHTTLPNTWLRPHECKFHVHGLCRSANSPSKCLHRHEWVCLCHSQFHFSNIFYISYIFKKKFKNWYIHFVEASILPNLLASVMPEPIPQLLCINGPIFKLIGRERLQLVVSSFFLIILEHLTLVQRLLRSWRQESLVVPRRFGNVGLGPVIRRLYINFLVFYCLVNQFGADWQIFWLLNQRLRDRGL